jgi:transposase-like protein
MTLRQAESGTPIDEICRKLGILEATFHRWKKRLGSLGISEVRELRQLREENRRLKSVWRISPSTRRSCRTRSEKNCEAGPTT